MIEDVIDIPTDPSLFEEWAKKLHCAIHRGENNIPVLHLGYPTEGLTPEKRAEMERLTLELIDCLEAYYHAVTGDSIQITRFETTGSDE